MADYFLDSTLQMDQRAVIAVGKVRVLVQRSARRREQAIIHRHQPRCDVRGVVRIPARHRVATQQHRDRASTVRSGAPGIPTVWRV